MLIITTIWVSRSARIGTSQAVGKVSEFYLEELAGRRALVVSEELKNKFTYMDNALAILGGEGEYLKSQETLRIFLGKVKKLYGVDKFALVNEKGIVYTEHSTTSGTSRYSFLSEELTEPVIHTSNLYGAKKQVVLAIPVKGISFFGVPFKACFIQVNIDEMLSSVTLQTSDNETFCNLYYRNGESLTGSPFGSIRRAATCFGCLRMPRWIWGIPTAAWRMILHKGRRGRFRSVTMGIRMTYAMSRWKAQTGC